MDRREGMVTIQLAVNGKLAVPITVEDSDFFDYPSEAEQAAFLKRSAESMIRIYGDARDGRTLSDQEVLDRANGVCV